MYEKEEKVFFLGACKQVSVRKRLLPVTTLGVESSVLLFISIWYRLDLFLFGNRLDLFLFGNRCENRPSV